MTLAEISSIRKIYQLIPDHLKSPYHHPDYVVLDAQEKKNASAIFFIYAEDQNIYYHPLHLVKTIEFDVYDLESARGYGGPISTSCEKSFLNRANEHYKKWIEMYGVCVEFVRFSPVLSNHAIYWGDILFDRVTVAIELMDYDLSYQSYRSRRYIKKTLAKEPRIYFDSQPTFSKLREFNSLYNQRMKELDATNHYLYSSNYFEMLFTCGAEMAWVELDGVMISAAIFIKNNYFFEYHLSASNDMGRAVGATNYLLHAVSEKYKDKIKIIHLGGGNNSNSENSLLQFKKGIGKLSLNYYVGRRIHNASIYNDLKLRFKIEDEKRVIFYRS